PVGAGGADRSNLHIPTSRRCYPRKALCRTTGSSWRDPLSPARLRQHTICVARANGRASVSQGSAFVAACAAICRSHLHSHGPLVRINRHESAGAAVDDLFFKPHAMDFLVHSYLQSGQSAAAKGVVNQIASIKIIPHILDAFAAAAMPARYAIERRRWDEAARLSLPQQETFAWKDFPHAEAALVFARALGAAR